MTRDEAIQELAEWIKQMKDHGVPNYSAKYKALDIAIEALEQEPVKHGEWKYYAKGNNKWGICSEYGKRTWYDTLKYWNGKEILRECKGKNRLCVHANVWNTCTDKPCEKGSKLLGKEADQFIVDEANAYTKGEQMTNRENGCIDCKHIDKMTEEEPCKRCRNNYLNLWEPMPKVREFTEDELIGAFRDAFVERRAIGILDIENKVKELFE